MFATGTFKIMITEFSKQSINHIQNCSHLKLTHLEIADQNVLKTKHPEGLHLRFC